MGLNCGCPAGAHLADLQIADCKESLGQIQKVIIQRRYGSAGVLNTIPEASIKSKTAMVALATAADGTKIIISPYIQNPTTTPEYDAKKKTFKFTFGKKGLLNVRTIESHASLSMMGTFHAFGVKLPESHVRYSVQISGNVLTFKL